MNLAQQDLAQQDLAQQDLATQLDAFVRIVRSNRYVRLVLSRLVELDLPHWYLTAGCLYQTVWNVVSGREPDQGIKDYDVFYFDASDLSWEAEDAVIKRCAEKFADLPVEVEVRNQARVHLWYPQKFGLPSAPFSSVEDGVDSFASPVCSIAIRELPGGTSRVYAPHGFRDMFGLVVRPNLNHPRSVYARGIEHKASRWMAEWPNLVVLPWPGEAASDESRLEPVST